MTFVFLLIVSPKDEISKPALESNSPVSRSSEREIDALDGRLPYWSGAFSLDSE